MNSKLVVYEDMALAFLEPIQDIQGSHLLCAARDRSQLTWQESTTIRHVWYAHHALRT